jgi:hypothetical protein
MRFIAINSYIIDYYMNIVRHACPYRKYVLPDIHDLFQRRRQSGGRVESWRGSSRPYQVQFNSQYLFRRLYQINIVFEHLVDDLVEFLASGFSLFSKIARPPHQDRPVGSVVRQV